MHTNIFGWLAFFSFIALLCTHPVRAKPFGPRLIALCASSIAGCLGIHLCLLTYRLYAVGQVPILSRSGGVVLISEHRTYAFFAICACIVFIASSFLAAIYMLKIAFMRKKSTRTRS
jgi:hypothetical protein